MDTALWVQQITGLTSSEKVVLLNLALHENPEDRQCFPSVLTQARETGLSAITVKRTIHKLERRGILRLERPNHYGGYSYTIIKTGITEAPEPQNNRYHSGQEQVSPRPEQVSLTTKTGITETPIKEKKGTQKKIKKRERTKSLLSVATVSPEEQDLIDQFNGLCKKYGSLAIHDAEKDHHTMRRILSDRRGNKGMFTLADIRNIGYYLKRQACRKKEDPKQKFCWIPNAIGTFSDLVKQTTTKVLYYQQITQQVEAEKDDQTP